MEQDIINKIQGCKVQGCEPAALPKDGTGQPKYVDAIKNSALGRWRLSHGETIPIPELSAAKQGPLVSLVDRILAAKSADPGADTAALEEQ